MFILKMLFNKKPLTEEQKAAKERKELRKAKIIICCFVILVLFTVGYSIYAKIKVNYNASKGIVSNVTDENSGITRDLSKNWFVEYLSLEEDPEIFDEPDYESVRLNRLPNDVESEISVPSSKDISSTPDMLVTKVDDMYIFASVHMENTEAAVKTVGELLGLGNDVSYNSSASGYFNSYIWECAYVTYMESKFNLFIYQNDYLDVYVGTSEPNNVVSTYDKSFEILRTYHIWNNEIHYAKSTAEEVVAMELAEKQEEEEIDRRLAELEEERKAENGDESLIIDPVHAYDVNFDKIGYIEGEGYVFLDFTNGNAIIDKVALVDVITTEYFYPDYEVFNSEEKNYFGRIYVDCSEFDKTREYKLLVTSYDEIDYAIIGTSDGTEISSYREKGADYFNVMHYDGEG